jgi:hypothetical protein
MVASLENPIKGPHLLQSDYFAVAAAGETKARLTPTAGGRLRRGERGRWQRRCRPLPFVNLGPDGGLNFYREAHLILGDRLALSSTVEKSPTSNG